MTAEVHEIYPPKPDLDAAIDFLKTINPDGRQMLVGYTDENGVPDTRHKLFEPGQWDQKRTLITLWASERRNIWVLPNEPKAGSLTGKDEDVAFIRAVWSDTDSKGVQAAAVDAVDNPFRAAHAAVVSDSGGGIHTFWLLKEKVPADAAAKALAEQVGRGLQAAFGGDPVWNINRPMRVPGTVNYLNEKKRKAGRNIAPTFVLAKGDGRVTLEQMAAEFPAASSAGAKATVTDEALKKAYAEIDMSKVGAPDGALMAKLKTTGVLTGLWATGVTSGDTSESGHLFRLALELHKKGFTGTEFAILAAAWGKIGANHLEHRSLARAWHGASQGAQAQRAFNDPGGTLPPEDEPEEDEPALVFPVAGGKTEKDIKPREWLYWKRLIRKYLSSTVAAGGTGKTALGLVEAMAMASKKNLLGIPDDDMPPEPLRVILWNGEDPHEELERRLCAAMKHHAVTEAELGGRLFIASGHDFPLRFDGNWTKGVARLVEAIKAHKADVVIIDPFVSSHIVPENDNVLIDRVAKTWSRIAKECGCAVDLVHHIRKPGSGGAVDLTTDDARGASALVNASRNARVLSIMPKPVADECGITNRKAYFAIQHDATKANMAPSAEGASWFRHVSVRLANGDVFGTPPTRDDSVGVVEAWTPASPLSSRPDNILKAQAEIAKQPCKKHFNAGNWVGNVVAPVFGLDPKDDRKQVEGIIKSWVKAGWLVVVKRQDEHREWKDFVEVGAVPEDESTF